MRKWLLGPTLVLLMTGCVGPAPTSDAYANKAEGTASAAVSSARTAVVAVQTALNGSLTKPALEVLLQESEDALGSVTNTFESLQPPDTPAADVLSMRLTRLLSDAGDDARDLRIAARRGDTQELETGADSLSATADELHRLAMELDS